MVRVMGAHEQRHPGPHELPQQPEDAGLVFQVQPGGRLIQDQQPRTGRDRPGNEDQLLLAPAQRREQPAGQFGDPHPVHGAERGGPVPAAG